MVKVRSCRLKERSDILAALLGLYLDGITRNLSGRRIHRDLSRTIRYSVHDESLGIRTDRRRCLFC